MSKPAIIGLYPIKKNGIVVAIIHIFRGMQEACHRRAILTGKAIAQAENEEFINNTGIDEEPRFFVETNNGNNR